MILLTRLSGSTFALNSDLIERVDSTPDTVITLAGGSKYVVAEDLLTVVTTVREHRAQVLALHDTYLTSLEEAASGSPRRRPALAVVSPHPGASATDAPTGDPS
ncbi:MAG: flagellar protein FlbD [Nocardioides sp.]|jgi:flagellar protein FlbD|nr:flagellar protein FlbD [Nocardioides sp.]